MSKLVFILARIGPCERKSFERRHGSAKAASASTRAEPRCHVHRPIKIHSRGVIGMAFIAMLAATSVRAASPPTLLMLPLDMVDASGETPSRAKEHEDRLEALASYLSRALTDDQVYSIIDPTPIIAAITAARSTQPLAECNGCERDLGRLLRADRVLVGQVDKVSTLIGSLSLRVVDVKSGRIVFGRTISFRGDTDEAWQHAARFFVRYLEETRLEER